MNTLSFKLARGISTPAAPRCRIRKSPWLVASWFDLLFVCGVAPWLFGFALFNIEPVFSSAGKFQGLASISQQALALGFITASLLIGETHQFTSIIRYYSVGKKGRKVELKERVPFWIMYAMLVVAAVSIGTHDPFFDWARNVLDSIAMFAMFMFPVVLLQHVCAQAISIAQIYCGNAGYHLSPPEKKALHVVSWTLTIAGAFGIATPFGFDPRALDDAVFGPIQDLALCTQGLTLVTIAVLIQKVIRRGITDGDWPPFPAQLLISNLTMFALLPQLIPGMIYVFLFVPLLFHATQHWSLAWNVELKEQKIDTKISNRQKTSKALSFSLPIFSLTLCVLFFPLITLRLAIPFSANQLGFGAQTLSVFLSMFVFYMHYFADRIVWRTKAQEGK